MSSTAAAASALDHHSHFKNKQNNTRRQEPTGPKVENSRTTPTKSKWQPPLHSPPPPQILHLPHPTRRRPRPATVTSTATSTTSKPTKSPPNQKPPPLPPCAERLETLFDQERSLDQRRKDELPETESTISGTPSSGESGIEKWRLQDENLGPECNFLRTERVALRSAADSLVSARRKIDGSESAEAAIARRRCGGGGPKEAEIGWSNFDRKALLLRRRLQEMNVREMMPKDKEKVDTVEAVDRGHDHDHDDVADVVSVKQFHQSVSDVSNSSTTSATALPEVEMLRRKMEIVSKGMLEKIEAYGTLLTTTATGNSSRTARTGRKGAVALLSKTVKVAASSGHCHHQQREECWGKCREVVRRIVEEVKVETEQWGEMQEMLKQVREEMDDLHCSRDFWERCAIQSDQKLRSTNTKVMEWTQRARSSEQRASELQRQVMELRSEAEELKEERSVAVASFQKEKLRRTPSASSAQQRRRPLREICNLTTVDKMKTKTKTKTNRK